MLFQFALQSAPLLFQFDCQSFHVCFTVCSVQLAPTSVMLASILFPAASAAHCSSEVFQLVSCSSYHCSLQLVHLVQCCSSMFYILPACAPCLVLFQHVVHSSSLCALSRVVPACSTFFQLVHLALCCSSMLYILPACALCSRLFQVVSLLSQISCPPCTCWSSSHSVPTLVHFAPASMDQYNNTKNSRHSYSSAEKVC